MRAIEIAEPGGPEVLRLVERDVPKVGPTDVLIRVLAAGVNRPDIFQRQGKYPAPSGVTDIPGLEIAGEVVARGSDVVSVVFTVATGQAWIRGLHIACGCLDLRLLGILPGSGPGQFLESTGFAFFRAIALAGAAFFLLIQIGADDSKSLLLSHLGVVFIQFRW